MSLHPCPVFEVPEEQHELPMQLSQKAIFTCERETS